MTLPQIIKLRTNDGLEIVDFLVDVMKDRYEDFQICHRLQAARLLTTYGNENAPDFVDDSTADSSPSTRKRKPGSPTRFDTELARVIREDTDDGRSIARFLVNVMVGEFTSFRPHHRMSAARELLDRGFGKSARNETPTPSVRLVENPRRRDPFEGPARKTHHNSTDLAEGSLPKDTTRQAPSPLTGEGWGEGEKVVHLEEQTLTHHSPPLIPGRGDRDGRPPTPQTIDNNYWLGIYDSRLYDFMGACEHPDFDPFLAAIDEGYFQSFTDCADPECEVHADPPDFDPNDYHY